MPFDAIVVDDIWQGRHAPAHLGHCDRNATLLTIKLLYNARALIAEKKNWTKVNMSVLRSDGRVARCAIGAVREAQSQVSYDVYELAVMTLNHAAKRYKYHAIWELNDSWWRPHARVLAAYDDAIAYLERRAMT